MRRRDAIAGAAAQAALLAGPALIAPRLEGALLVALATVFLVVETAAQGRGRDEPGDRGSLVSGVALLAVLASALALGRPVGAGWAIAGMALFAGGVLLRAAALRALGAWFVSGARLSPGQPLVTSGVYRVLRHPSETGLLAVAAGVALLGGSAIAGAIAAALLLPSVVVRIRREDALLQRAFGAEHAAWARRVGALLP